MNFLRTLYNSPGSEKAKDTQSWTPKRDLRSSGRKLANAGQPWLISLLFCAILGRGVYVASASRHVSVLPRAPLTVHGLVCSKDASLDRDSDESERWQLERNTWQLVHDLYRYVYYQ
jgi:hypothetical protein